MIQIHRPDGSAFFINVTHIVTAETTPDTVVTLFNGDKLRVRESASELSDLVVAWFQRIGHPTMVPYVNRADRPNNDDDKDE
jgi:flagellar protein FlbD